MPSDSSALKPISKADPSTSSLPDVPKPSKKEAELKEFMNTMTRSKKAPAWTNDEPVVTPSLPPSADAPTKKSKKDTKLNSVDEAGVSEPMSVILDLSPTTDVGNDVDAPDPGMSDLDWMKKRMSQAVEIEGKVFDQSGDEAMADDTNDQIHPTIHVCDFIMSFVTQPVADVYSRPWKFYMSQRIPSSRLFHPQLDFLCEIWLSRAPRTSSEHSLNHSGKSRRYMFSPRLSFISPCFLSSSSCNG
jgi:hypothetical protein